MKTDGETAKGGNAHHGSKGYIRPGIFMYDSVFPFGWAMEIVNFHSLK